jgi:hypothetical protein
VIWCNFGLTVLVMVMRMFLASPFLTSQRSFGIVVIAHGEFYPTFIFLERRHASQNCFFLLLEIYFYHLCPTGV